MFKIIFCYTQNTGSNEVVQSPLPPQKKTADKVLKYQTKNVYKQEGISVACQPLACVVYTVKKFEHLQRCRGGHVSVQSGPSWTSMNMSTPTPPRWHRIRHTDTTENTFFPQLLWQVVMITCKIQVLIQLVPCGIQVVCRASRMFHLLVRPLCACARTSFVGNVEAASTPTLKYDRNRMT